jgi:hypothetical protein
VLINLSAARVFSALVTTIVHEPGHFAISLSLGNSATLYHNRVETPGENLNFRNQLFIPMGGPLISLSQGVICILLFKKVKNGITSLTVLWLGISGLMAFFGYIMIAPVAQEGDTGKIFALLENPFWWEFIIALLGLLIFTYMLIFFHRSLENFITEDISNGKLMRTNWARLLIMYPVMIGIVVTSILTFPIIVFLSLLPSIMMPFMLFMVYSRMVTSKSKIEKEQNKDVTELSIPLIILLLFTIVLNRVLVWGISL